MSYYVYLIASRKDGAIYIGITNDIVRRVYEHRIKAVPGFTSKYNITRLVWFEIYDDPISAISREKEMKKWKRAWRTQLIETQNPAVERPVRVDLYLNSSFRARQRREPGISRFRARCFASPRNDIDGFTPSPRAAGGPLPPLPLP